MTYTQQSSTDAGPCADVHAVPIMADAMVAPHGVLTVGALWTLGSILQALIHV